MENQIKKNNIPKRKKFQRATSEQLKYFTEILEERSEILLNPSNFLELWRELAEQLNSMRGPTRTAKKWRASLTHWRNQIRSRARKQQERNSEKFTISKLHENALKTLDLNVTKVETKFPKNNFECPSTSSGTSSFQSCTSEIWTDEKTKWDELYKLQVVIAGSVQNIDRTLSELKDILKSKELQNCKAG